MNWRTVQGLIRVPVPSDLEREKFEKNYCQTFGCKDDGGVCKWCGKKTK